MKSTRENSESIKSASPRLRGVISRPPEELARILKRRLRSGKRFYGVFYRDVDSQLDEFLYKRYFSNDRPGICLECGALDGIMMSNSLFFEESLGWVCHNIEASPESFKLLAHNRKNSHNYNIALSDKDGEACFSLSSVASGQDAVVDASFTSTGCVETVSVVAQRYTTFIRQANIERIDLFILDVEGHEIEVINGMRGATIFPYIFCVECWNETQFGAVNNLLEEFGYTFDARVYNNYIFVHMI